MDLQARYELEHLKTAMATLAERVERVEEALSISVPLDSSFKGTLLAARIEPPAQKALRLVEELSSEPTVFEVSRSFEAQPVILEAFSPATLEEPMLEAPQTFYSEQLGHQAEQVSEQVEQPVPQIEQPALTQLALDLRPSAHQPSNQNTNIVERPVNSFDIAAAAQVNSDLPNHAAEPLQRPSLELEIGLYWLNRLGITSLVIGVALFLMYSFQYFGPAAKIVTGLLVAIGLLLGGEWMERKGGPKWYARSLMGGGWSLAYFTVFAMYHIPSVKVIHDFTLDWLLLNGVTVGAMWHCVSKRSEWTAMLALVLGLVTFGFSEVSIPGAIATAVLVESLCVLSRKMGWSRLYFWGLLGAYGTFHLGLSQKIFDLKLGTLDNFWLTAAYLLVIWTPLLVTSLMMKEDKPWRRQLLVAGSLINVLAFVPPMLIAARPVFQDSLYLVAIGIAAIYAVAARVARLKGLSGMEHVYLLSSLSVGTAAIPMKLKSNWLSVWWLAEIPLLSFLGLTYRLPVMRFFANFMILITMMFTLIMQWGDKKLPIFNFQIPEGLLHIAFAITAYSLTAMSYRMWRTRHGVVSEYSGFSFYMYLACAGFFAWLMPLRVVNILPLNGEPMSDVMQSSILVALWIMQPAVLLAIGLTLKDKLLKYAAIAAFVVGGLGVISIYNANTSAHIFAAAIVYGVAALVRSKKIDLPESERKIHFRTYISLASFMVWVLTWVDFESNMTVLWTLEAAATVALGLWLKDSFVEGLGALWFVTIGGTLCTSLGHWNIFQTGVMLCALYACSAAYRRLSSREPGNDHRTTAQMYEAVAAIIATLLVKEHVPANCLAFAWSLEGLLLLTLGFIIQDRPSRIYGLAIFALVGGKLLLVDLAGAETLQRILSFVVAGVVLLIASYAYSIFERRFAVVTREDQRESERKLAA